MAGKGNKFGARRCACSQGGAAHWHDSQAERSRCLVLHYLRDTGALTNLRIHWPKYDLLAVGGSKVGTFTPDFTYTGADGRRVVEDVKAPPTRMGEAYRLRKRLFEACHAPLTIREVD